jgi:hypothetical protein
MHVKSLLRIWEIRYDWILIDPLLLWVFLWMRSMGFLERVTTNGSSYVT